VPLPPRRNALGGIKKLALFGPKKSPSSPTIRLRSRPTSPGSESPDIRALRSPFSRASPSRRLCCDSVMRRRLYHVGRWENSSCVWAVEPCSFSGNSVHRIEQRTPFANENGTRLWKKGATRSGKTTQRTRPKRQIAKALKFKPAHVLEKWCPGAGSNHRHCDFQAAVPAL